MGLNEPVDQRGTDGLLDLWLSLHVVGVSPPLALSLQHVLLNLGTKLGDVINVVDGLPVVLG